MDTVDDTEGVTEVAEVPTARLATERLEAEICTLAGQLAVMECRWLLLVGEFDRRRGFDGWECRSTAHWLTWKFAMGSRTAHEKVRIARRLDELPLVTEAFARGELSYSKVRAITRIAVPATEADLVSIARHATGAQIERLAGGRRKADHLEAERTGEGDPGYEVRWFHDEAGAVVINARLAPESGSVVVQAMEEAVRQERATDPDTEPAAEPDRNGSQKCSAEHTSDHPEGSAGVDGPDRNNAAVAADALVAIAVDPRRAGHGPGHRRRGGAPRPHHERHARAPGARGRRTAAVRDRCIPRAAEPGRGHPVAGRGRRP
jgi:hypothetical protein